MLNTICGRFGMLRFSDEHRSSEFQTPWVQKTYLEVVNERRYYCEMIRSFRDNRTENVFYRLRVKGVSQIIQRAALRKLLILDAAEMLDDLRVPPGNRLEKLHGDRMGQFSIRVNDQWRICFVWKDGGAEVVEFTDYH